MNKTILDRIAEEVHARKRKNEPSATIVYIGQQESSELMGAMSADIMELFEVATKADPPRVYGMSICEIDSRSHLSLSDHACANMC